ncbi:nitrate reductase molybdenum cofactor assembly chaperone [Rhodococcus olei]|uniref:Nitrate reductase molybdenum cofactor assembly chaperone n=1 Tax=Rhodococcus olei TaxID=2161675 RepID=A0ABP8NZU9_9NOCA
MDQRQRRIVWQSASLLLAYPDDGQGARLTTVTGLLAHLPGELADPLAAVVRDLSRRPVLESAAGYVDTFDLRRRTTLLLTYWTDGDTRNRGAAILDFARAYREAGAEPPAAESADHLAVVLEFAATVDPEVGARLLAANRAAIDVLRERLEESGSPYAAVLGAVAATLPPAGALDRERARSGPPAEAVGLQPFTLTVPPRTSSGGPPPGRRHEGAH